MTRSERLRGVRTLSGLFAVRQCMPTEQGFVWLEELYHDAEPYLDENSLAAFSEISGTNIVSPLLPTLTDLRRAHWPAVEAPELLFDSVFAGLPDPWPSPTTFVEVGHFIGHLHKVTATGTLEKLPNRQTEPAWMSAAPQIAGAARTIADELAKVAGPVISELVHQESESMPASCLVHGRFSVGLCVVADKISVLGWREAGWGDPMQDLGYMLGELAECAAVATFRDGMESRSCARLLAAAKALCLGYQEGIERPLSEDEWIRAGRRTAERVLDVMALHAITFGSVERPIRLVRRADERISAIFSEAC